MHVHVHAHEQVQKHVRTCMRTTKHRSTHLHGAPTHLLCRACLLDDVPHNTEWKVHRTQTHALHGDACNEWKALRLARLVAMREHQKTARVMAQAIPLVISERLQKRRQHRLN